jgi:hypothetical protein
MSPVRTSGSVEIGDDDTRVKVVFSDHDRRLVHQYYGSGKKKKHGKKKRIPPGLAKKGCNHPGLQKHLQKNYKLPPELKGRYLPRDLERKLKRIPSDYVRIRVGTDIVLMERETRIILDVITGVPF